MILAQLADCPLNRLKTGKSIREGASLSAGPSAEVPDTKAHPLVYSIPPVRRTGGVRLFPHGPQGRGRLEDYSLSWPGGPGRRKTIWGYVPFLAQHWAYGSIPGFMAPFWPPSGLWFRSGSILALWFRFGLLDKSCAKQRRPRPEHTGGGICLAQIL